MQWTVVHEPLTSIPVDCHAICVAAPAKEAKPAHGTLGRADGGVECDHALGGLLTEMIRREEFRGEVGQYRLIPTQGKTAARYLLLTGAGEPKRFTLETARRLGAVIAKAADEAKLRSVAGVLQPEALAGLSPEARGKALAEGLLLGQYRFDRFKAKADRREPSLSAVTLVVAKERAAVLRSLQAGQVIAEATCAARDLANLPGNLCTPQYLAEQARTIARQGRLACTIFDQKEIVAHRMALLQAVAQGAANPPVFIHLRYTPSKKAKAHVALVGKGVTFDTGGVDLKPSKQMEHMKNDMAGAAAVLAVMQAIPAMQPSLLIDAFCPCTENVIDGKSHRPGDIVTSRSGKTIELVNLDAEGRLILADALDYAIEKKPDYVIDVATLTGGVLYAVGELYSAVLGNDQKLIDRILAASKTAGEPMWHLPLEQEYKKGFTTGPAELRNIGKTCASTISGALFLQEFVGDRRWAHIDIAAASWTDEERPYAPRGGTGTPVRTLCEFLMGLT